MYRIRLASGEEAVYRTAEELAQAVGSGVVSPTAEVFHNSAGRWLPINVHPDYRAVITGKRPAAAAAPVISGSRPRIPLAPKPATADDPPAKTAAPAPILPRQPLLSAAAPLQVEPQPLAQFRSFREPLAGGTTRADKLRGMLSLAMGLAAIGMVGGGAVLAWPYLSAWVSTHREHRVTLSEGMPPVPMAMPIDTSTASAAAPSQGDATRRLDSLPRLYPAPSKPLAAAPAASDTFTPPGQEETRVSRFTATRTKLPSYFEAYADARSEMDDGFDYVSFQRVFAPSRFAAPESVRAARRMVTAAGNILRVYRGREVMLEQTYRPDDPGGRGSLREPFETAEASRALLADVDSLFGLLVSQQGRYSYANEGVRFQDARTARTYSQLRAEILSTLSDWRDSSGATNRVTLPRLLQALGGTTPPPAR